MLKVIIVHLRRPRSKSTKSDETRSDPFWEFGSFGITGCHSRNLMHSKNADKLNGVRFAFAQGGKQGTRLIYMTPPVRIVKHRHCIEATWSPAEMPFRYDHAPILASNKGRSDFSELESALNWCRGQPSKVSSQVIFEAEPLVSLTISQMNSSVSTQPNAGKRKA